MHTPHRAFCIMEQCTTLSQRKKTNKKQTKQKQYKLINEVFNNHLHMYASKIHRSGSFWTVKNSSKLHWTRLCTIHSYLSRKTSSVTENKTSDIKRQKKDVLKNSFYPVATALMSLSCQYVHLCVCVCVYVSTYWLLFCGHKRTLKHAQMSFFTACCRSSHASQKHVT